MHAFVAKAAAFIHTKAALALLGAALVAGGGSAVALAATHANPGYLLSSLAGSTHGTSHGTSHGEQGDQGHEVAAEGTLAKYSAPSASAPGSAIVQKDDGTSVTFSVNSDTRVNGSHASALADLPGVVGSRVQVQGEQQRSGNPLATKITVQGSARSVEIHGTVGTINLTSNSFTVTTDSGTVTITVTGDTKFSHDDGGLGGLHAGSRVNVQGVKQPDSTVVATHVEVGGGQGPGSTHTPHADHTPEATESTGD